MTFLMALSHYNLFLTIMGYYCNDTALAILASVAFLLAALRTSHRWRAVVALLFSSFFATLSFMLYFTGRMLIGGIGLIWLHEFIQRRDFWRRRGWMLLLWAAVFALFIIKPYQSVERDKEKGEARQRQTSLMYRTNVERLLAERQTDNVFKAFAGNIAQSLLVYTSKGYKDRPNSYHAYETSTPHVDRYSAVLLGIGILIVLWRWRDIRYSTLLAFWLFYNIIPSGLTVLDSPPYSPRAHVGMLFAWMLGRPSPRSASR